MKTQEEIFNFLGLKKLNIMTEHRNGVIPLPEEIGADQFVEHFKMHLLSHTHTRELLEDYESDLKSAKTLPDVVGVLQNLSGFELNKMKRILSSWVRKPKRNGYKSDLVNDEVRQVLADSGLLLDNPA